MRFKIDVKAFKIDPADARKHFQGLAHLAEIADRHEDMCAFMREVVKAAANGPDLDFDERNLLSVAYKNAVGARRASWRALGSDSAAPPTIARFREFVERELEALCRDVLDLLENILIPHERATEEARVFYQKMAGDYYRYLAEFIVGPELETYQTKSAEFYEKAMNTAQAIMEPTDPVRLGLALNYSVCLYEILKDRDRACQLARSAFDEAIARVETLKEPQYKDGTLILQLLRDNLTLWTNQADEADAQYSNQQQIGDQHPQ